MRIGLGLYPDVAAPEVVRLGRLAESLGYAGIWLPDSHLLWREPYVVLGALGLATRTIRLATAVTNPLTRRPSVTASAFATLAELAPGRAVIGIGVGDSALRTMGEKPATLRHLEASIADIRTLLTGAGLGENPAFRLAFAPGEIIPIYIAASGPRMLHLAGRIADGVILMNGTAPDLISAADALIGAGEREAGRAPGTVKRLVWAAAHVAPGDPRTSYDALRYNVARAILRDLPGLDSATRALASQVRAHYDYAQHGSAQAGFARLIPDALVPRFTFAGRPEDVAAQIRALGALGIDEVALAIPEAPGALAREAVMRLLSPGALASLA
ncbi:MAG: LLM class flavin-dependent oxidoreductase [Alphaproteobacteria bacterium]|nr:LLM class flavin-dependent oxidoreductase [Alphaproteobacteria bacterium]